MNLRLLKLRTIRNINSYKIIFDKLRSRSNATRVQIGEIQFFETPDGSSDPIISPTASIDRTLDKDHIDLDDAGSKLFIWVPGKIDDKVQIKLPGNSDDWQGSHHSLDFSPDSKLLAVANKNHTHCELINTKDGTLFQKIPIAQASTIKFSPSGKKILINTSSGKVFIWNINANTIELESKSDPKSIAIWSPNEKTILLPNIQNNQSVVINVNTKKEIFLNHQSNVHNNAVFSPDGTKILTLTRGDVTFNVWDSKTGTLLHRLKHSVGPLLSSNNNQQPSKWWHATGNFSPDGKTIITFADDFTARLWNSANGQLIDQSNITQRISGDFEPLFNKLGNRYMVNLRDNSKVYIGSLNKNGLELPYSNEIVDLVAGYSHILNDGNQAFNLPVGEVISGAHNHEDSSILKQAVRKPCSHRTYKR